VALLPDEKSKIVYPMAASVLRTALVPGIAVIPNGRRPPEAGVEAVKLLERLPSWATSKAARNPGVGGTPLTAAKS